MEKGYILNFDDKEATETSLVGGKGASLSVLKQNGFNVPDGFIVTTFFFKEVLKDLNLYETYRKISESNFDKELIDKFKENFSLKHIPEDKLNIIKEKLSGKLNEWELFAVRSSFTFEDLQTQSFAGQGKTFLGLSDTELLEEKLKETFLSVFSDSSVNYLKKNQGPADFNIAVIIQRFISPDFSGIVFSNWDNDILIELIPGPGFPLANGITEGIRLTFSKDSLKLKEKYIPERINTGKISENREIILNNIKFFGRLPFKEIKKLIAESIRAEKIYGTALDIEWSLYNGEIFFLQARPITTKLEKEKVIHWSKVLGEEFWSGRVTPLMFSTIGRAIEETMIKEPLVILGDEKYKEIKKGSAIGLFYRHLYINVDILSEAFSIIPKWAITEELTKMLPEDLAKKVKDNGKIIPLSLLSSFVRFVKERFPWMFHNNYKIFDEYVKNNLDKFNIEKEKYLNSDSKEILDTIEEIKDGLKDFLRIVVWGVTYAYISVPLTEKVFSLMVGEEASKKYSYQLFTNLPGDQNLKFIEELNELRKLLPETLKTEPTLERLSKCKDKKFLEKWNKFITNYGHRTEERDISFPRWGEEPEIVLKIISSLNSENIYRQFSTGETIKNIREQLRKDEIFINYLFYPGFVVFLWLARTYLTVRENMRFYADFFLYNMRKLFLILEERLLKQGKIENKGDIFYLELEDIKKYYDGEKTDLKEIVNLNKKEEEKNINITPPDFIIGDIPVNIKDINRERISGITISPGIVKGVARVIKDQRDLLNIKKDEIAVLNNLDPSWSPILINASGAIFEVGGLLSHGAIIAREYAIPSIAGVKKATEIIKDGDKLLLNATDGNVTFID